MNPMVSGFTSRPLMSEVNTFSTAAVLDFGGMMGGSLSCASCHGEDGRGGQHVMHMDVMDAPDIRFETLSTEESGHLGDEQEDEHGEEYDIETFHQAVVLGQHPDGDTLSRDMPRWDMSEDDLIALFEYLKTLP